MIAVEAMRGRVHLHLHVRMRLPQRRHAFERNRRVGLRKMREHRAPGLARNLGRQRHATAVVRHGRADTREQAGRAPGQQAAPAITHHADLARAGGVIDGGLDVLLHARGGQSLGRSLQGDAGRDVLWRVAEFNAGLQPVKGRRRNGQKTHGGIAFGHGADVRIDAEDLLQHDDRAFGCSCRTRLVSRELETVRRCQLDEMCHVPA